MSKYETFQRNAVCPFFRSANHERLHCTGIIPGTKIATRFPTVTACHYYVKRVCSDLDACQTCPIYQANEKKI